MMGDILVSHYTVRGDGTETHCDFIKSGSELYLSTIGSNSKVIGMGHNPLCHSLHYATAAFEGIRAFWDAERQALHVLNLNEHVQRFYNSMHALHMLPPKHDDSSTVNAVIPNSVAMKLKEYDAQQDVYFQKGVSFLKEMVIKYLIKAVDRGLIDPKSGQIYVRPLVYRSSHSENKLGVHSATHDITLEVLAQQWPAYLDKPALAVYPEVVQDPSRQYKLSCNYGTGGRAKNWATSVLASRIGKKFDDALLLDPSMNVLEATGANFFAFNSNGNELFTPPSTNAILPGTKRGIAIEIARALGVTVTEIDISHLDLLATNSEGNNSHLRDAFLTGTATGIEPIHLLFDPRYNRYTVFYDDETRNEALREMKRQYQLLVTGGNVESALNELQQRIVLANAVDLSSTSWHKTRGK